MTEVGDKFTKKLDFSHTGIGEPGLGGPMHGEGCVNV